MEEDELISDTEDAPVRAVAAILASVLNLHSIGTTWFRWNKKTCNGGEKRENQEAKGCGRSAPIKETGNGQSKGELSRVILFLKILYPSRSRTRSNAIHIFWAKLNFSNTLSISRYSWAISTRVPILIRSFSELVIQNTPLSWTLNPSPKEEVGKSLRMPNVYLLYTSLISIHL